MVGALIGGIAVALLVARLLAPHQNALAVVVLLACALLAAVHGEIRVKRREQRQRSADASLAEMLDGFRRACMQTHANPSRFSWDEAAVREVLTGLAGEARATAQRLALLRDAQAPLTERSCACVARTLQALHLLASQLTAYAATLSREQADAVRYGLDPFSAYLSAAEVALAECVGEWRQRAQSSAPETSPPPGRVQPSGQR